MSSASRILKVRNPIAKQAKYQALSSNTLAHKIEKRTASKKFWYGVLRAVERFVPRPRRPDSLPSAEGIRPPRREAMRERIFTDVK
jgi:hypothetical protein